MEDLNLLKKMMLLEIGELLQLPTPYQEKLHTLLQQKDINFLRGVLNTIGVLLEAIGEEKIQIQVPRHREKHHFPQQKVSTV
ncbi:MAG: hypothetical protein QXY76_03260 [Nitrososphaeria archaeon]